VLPPIALRYAVIGNVSGRVMKLSIVATLYCSAPTVEEFCRRCGTAARQLVGDDFEIILVNDGSPDNSLQLAVRLAAADPRLVVVDLSRNFGHHRAMMTGMAQARGSRVFLLDSDLEEDPAWLSSFSRQMDEQPCDVVYGVQDKRKGGWFERWSGEVFYRIFRRATRLPLPNNPVVARLMTRRYVAALLRHGEREVFLPGLWVITGFDQSPRVIHKESAGRTTYTFRRKFAHFVNSVTSFSNAPLAAIFYSGAAIFILSACYASYLCYRRLVFARRVDGWTSMMVSIWMLGGLIILFLGVIGVYLAKVFSEVKARPNSIVRQVYGAGAGGVDGTPH
jgi:putative glycosyltransferase